MFPLAPPFPYIPAIALAHIRPQYSAHCAAVIELGAIHIESVHVPGTIHLDTAGDTILHLQYLFDDVVDDTDGLVELEPIDVLAVDEHIATPWTVTPAQVAFQYARFLNTVGDALQLVADDSLTHFVTALAGFIVAIIPIAVVIKNILFIFLIPFLVLNKNHHCFWWSGS